MLLLAAPARAQLVSGTDCGCTTTGAFVDPDPGVKPFVAPNGDSAPSGAKYRVSVSAGPPVIADVVPLAGGVPSGPSRLTTTGSFWGFSPGQDRFLIWSVTGTAPNTVIQADLYDLTTTPATHRRTFGGAFTSKRYRFSADGRYLLMAATAFGDTQIQLEWVEAATGSVRRSTSFPVSSPPGMVGDEFDVAGWGFGPAASRVVYAYVSGGLPYTAVDDLGDAVQAPVFSAQTHISAFWQFSPCGDVFGVVNQRFASSFEVNLWKTRGGASIGGTAFTDPNVSLATTAAQHQASVPGTTVDVAPNGAGNACVNVPPVVDFSYSGTLEAGQTIQFSDASTDTDGQVVSWSWDFGDGATSSLQSPTHVYAQGGTYAVTLTVTDAGGATHARTRQITLCSAAIANGGKLLYRRGITSGDLYALNLNGTGTVRITNGDEMNSAQIDGYSTDADWSPDGSKIAFVTVNPTEFPGDGAGLQVSNADGSGRVLLLPRPTECAQIFAPRWTPDGLAILFFLDDTIATPTPRFGLYLIDADGTNLRAVGNASWPGGFSSVPTCGGGGGRVPDGCWKLAVRAVWGGTDNEVWKVQADGSGFTKLTDGPADLSPRFSPDGTKLVFTRGYTPQTLYVANADGSGAHAVATPPANSEEEGPVWSPDGTKIAFTRAFYPTGSITRRDLVVIGADGCHGGTVATGDPYEYALSWVPGAAVQGPGSISGRVFFGGYLTNPSAAGVTVTVSWNGGSASALTAADGSYLVGGIPPGADVTSITASHPGYVWDWPGPLGGFPGYDFPGFSGHASGVWLGMQVDHFTLEGTVRDENGIPLSGIVIGASGPSAVSPATTGADGRFSLALAADQIFTVAPLTLAYEYVPESATAGGSYGGVGTQDFVATLIVPPTVTPPIVFSSDRAGLPGSSPNFEIWAAEPDGSGAVRLTRDPALDTSPAWSPDGTRIAFVRDVAGAPHLHVMSKDGTAAVDLGIEGETPSWSPDGAQLAYSRSGGIYVADASGANETPLTNGTNGLDARPVFSRDGLRVAFERQDFASGEVDLVEIERATANEALLLMRPGDDRAPAWSPDGSTFAVSYDPALSGAGELVTVSADLSTLTPLGVSGSDPAFSDDGRIAFTDTASGSIGVLTLGVPGALAFPKPAGATELDPDWRLSAAPPDTDGDGVADASDNCPFAANGANEAGVPGVGDQLDSGGVGAASAPDGIGDACQCGDVSGDGLVTLADTVGVQRSLLQPPTATLAHPDRCDVGGPAGCSLFDAVVLRRALLAPPTAAIGQQCAPAGP
jgi:Tol biopolymer transport system component/chitodextrinase